MVVLMNKELFLKKIEVEKSLKDIYSNLDEICFYNSMKVMNAFRKVNIKDILNSLKSVNLIYIFLAFIATFIYIFLCGHYCYFII